MLDLDLDKVTATLEHLNTRTEKSGPDDVPAATIKVSCAQSADVLAYFSPELRSFLFDTEGPKDLAGGMSIRNPHLEYPIGLDHEMTGATVRIEYGVGKPIEFSVQAVIDLLIALPALFADVRERAQKIADFRREQLEADVKNS